MKKSSLSDNEIIAVNRECYDALGSDYTDGAEDLEKLERNGIWSEFLSALPGGVVKSSTSLAAPVTLQFG